jgi:hypothetical protein
MNTEKKTSLSARFPAAAQLFGAYFHQDWDANSTNPDDIVRDFAETQNEEVRKRAMKDIEMLLVEFKSEDALKLALDEFANYYNARRSEGSYRAWMERIVAILRFASTAKSRAR